MFAARTRGPFWSIRPAPILLVAVVGTQLAATLIAVYGLFMHPLGWAYAGLVWGNTLGMFLIQDRVNPPGHRILARQRSGLPVEEANR